MGRSLHPEYLFRGPTTDNLDRIADYLVNSYLPQQQWWRYYMYDRLGGRKSLRASARAYTKAAWEARGQPYYNEVESTAANDEVWKNILKEASDGFRKSVRPEVDPRYSGNGLPSLEGERERLGQDDMDLSLGEEAHDPFEDTNPELVSDLVQFLLDEGWLDEWEAALMENYRFKSKKNSEIALEFGISNRHLRSKVLTIKRRVGRKMSRGELPERFKFVIQGGTEEA